eukprot:PhF_6_TR29080/c0_g1_i1/m.42390
MAKVCTPTQCFFPMEALEQQRPVVNKLTLFCPPSLPQGCEFAVRATHQYEVEVEPRAGRLVPNVPVSLYVKWRGDVPKDPQTFEGLKPQKQPRLRIDITPKSVEAILIDITFQFPSPTHSFCYTLNGTEWFDSSQIISSANKGSAPSAAGGEDTQETSTPMMTTSLSSGSFYALEVHTTDSVAAREQVRRDWMIHSKERDRTNTLEIQQEVA